MDLGTIGWAGEEALYVPRPTLTSAYEAPGGVNLGWRFWGV